jgi:hypothetical protein
MKRYITIILSSALLSSSSYAAEYEGPLKTAALIIVAGADCGVTADEGKFEALLQKGAKDKKMTGDQAVKFVTGLAVAYSDIISRSGSVDQFCSVFEEAGE